MGVTLAMFGVVWSLRTNSITAVTLLRTQMPSQFRPLRRPGRLHQADVWISELVPCGSPMMSQALALAGVHSRLRRVFSQGLREVFLLSRPSRVKGLPPRIDERCSHHPHVTVADEGPPGRHPQ